MSHLNALHTHSQWDSIIIITWLLSVSYWILASASRCVCVPPQLPFEPAVVSNSSPLPPTPPLFHDWMHEWWWWWCSWRGRLTLMKSWWWWLVTHTASSKGLEPWIHTLTHTYTTTSSPNFSYVTHYSHIVIIFCVCVWRVAVPKGVRLVEANGLWLIMGHT